MKNIFSAYFTIFLVLTFRAACHLNGKNASFYNGTYSVDVFGSLISPNYEIGFNYPNNTDIYWVLEKPDDADDGILVNFLYFSTEPANDFVVVYKGDEILPENELKRYTGFLQPFGENFNESSIIIRFQSNYIGTSQGFYLTYSLTKHLQGWIPANNTPQFVTSPSYDSYYAPNLNFYWIINSFDGYQINLIWQDLDTKLSKDYVVIYDGYGLLTRTFAKYSGGSLPKSNFTSANYIITIQFTTHQNATNHRGFKIGFNTFTQLCNVDTYFHEGQAVNELITSPNYPNNYCNDITKFYYIIVDAFYFVFINFTDFKLAYFDSLQIFDGYGTDTHEIVTLNWETIAPVHFNSTYRYMTLKFITDSSNEATGFRAIFSSISKNINADTGDSVALLDGGQIAGIVIGGFVVLIISVLTIVFFIRSRRKKRYANEANENDPRKNSTHIVRSNGSSQPIYFNELSNGSVESPIILQRPHSDTNLAVFKNNGFSNTDAIRSSEI